MNHEEFFNRVAVWNDLRYQQVFDVDLTVNLLKEEAQETEKAMQTAFNNPEQNSDANLAEILDGLADICFVAAGAIWKHGIKPDISTIKCFETFHGLSPRNINKHIDHICIGLRMFSGKYVQIVNLHDAYCLAFTHLCIALNSEDLAFQVLEIIADSNDTKEVKKLIPSDKGYVAGESKGVNYVAPTERLIALLESQNGTKN